MRWMEDKIELMVTYLVHLQFYSEEREVLFSRDKKSNLHIPGIGPVISAFVSELLRPIEHIRAGEYRLYLTELSRVLPFDIDTIETDFNKSISQLPENQRSPELIVNFLVGPIRSTIQNHEFEKVMGQILETSIGKLGVKDAKEVIGTRIEELYSRNEENVAILYSLVFLRFIVSIYGSDDLFHTVNVIVNKYSENLVSLLLTM